MKPYLEMIKTDLRLALRMKGVLFFNYVFPLLFFFVFAEFMDAGQGGTITFIVSMVLVLGILGNGLFGAGMRAVQEREANILRRYRVAPITPMPILVASLVTGWVLYLPVLLIVLTLAHFLYGMPVPDRWFSLLLLISIGVVAFRGLGLILASVANSMQEANVLIQILYMPMLFLSGATFPLTILPDWAQILSQFLPASYLVTGFQGIFIRGESFLVNWFPALALLISMSLSLFVANQLFRWEKEEKIPNSSKLWVVAVLLPFVLLGTYQAFSRDQIEKAEQLWRDMQRRETVLIRGARIFVGDGRVIESGSVLVKEGKIDIVFEGVAPSAESLGAAVLEGAGKTLLPGLIDVHVHLAAPGGVVGEASDFNPQDSMERALITYLFSGVTAVRSVGDALDPALSLKQRITDGGLLGAELFNACPLFTTEGGHGTEYFDEIPEMFRQMALNQFVRIPSSADEARRQVRELQSRGVDAIKLVLEGGVADMLFDRLDLSLGRAVADEAAALGLPLAVHTGDRRDVADAVSIGAKSIEHGSARDEIGAEVFERMAAGGTFYSPTLSVVEAVGELIKGSSRLLDRSLLQQVGPQAMLDATRAAIESGRLQEAYRRHANFGNLETARVNLVAAYQSSVQLVTGSDAGNLLVVHGPGVHRELELWVESGIPSSVALQAATYNAARLLGRGDRMGLVAPGYDANLLLVDGNPLEEISATSRISAVFFQGERINRARLFGQ